MADQTVLRTRDETRMAIARTLRGEFENRATTMRCDDRKLLLLSELVLRIAEGAA